MPQRTDVIINFTTKPVAIAAFMVCLHGAAAVMTRNRGNVLLLAFPSVQDPQTTRNSDIRFGYPNYVENVPSLREKFSRYL